MIASTHSDRIAISALSLLFLLMCFLTWNTYGSLLIDSFHDIWFPQQLLEGDSLYRDLHYQYGPLPPYLLTLIFYFTGISFTVLSCVGMCIAFICATFIYALCRKFTSPLGAAAAVLTFLMHSVFCRYGSADIDIFNFIRPYSIASTLYILAALGALYFLVQDVLNPNKKFYTLHTFFLVLAFLCRPVMALTLGLVFLVFNFFFLKQRKTLALAAPLLITALVYGLYLGLTKSSDPFLEYTFFFAFLSKNSAFNSGMMGLNDWPQHIRLTFIIVAAHALVIAPILFLCKKQGAWSRQRRAALGALFALMALGAFVFLWRWENPLHGNWLYQYQAILVCHVAGLLYFFKKAFFEKDRRSIALLAFVLISMTASLRMLLHPVPYVYGFFLLVPSFALYIICLFEFVPRQFFSENEIKEKTQYQIALFICILCVGLAQIQPYAHYQKMRTFTLNTPVGEIVLPETSITHQFSIAAEYIKNHTPKESTLLVIPEGIGLNVLSERTNPFSFSHLLPPDIELFGERFIIDAIAQEDLDYIAIMHRPTPEYGVPTFGIDYAQNLALWLREHFTPIEVFGHIPFQGQGFGIMLAKKNRTK